jgi:phage gpG-like protein
MIRVRILGLEKLRLAGKVFFAMRGAFTQAIDFRMRLFGQAVVDRAKSRYLSGRPGLNAPTGRLRSSINWEVTGDTKKELRVGTNLIYGRIHE